MTLKNDHLRMFLNDWECVLTGVGPTPKDDVTEPLFHVQIGKSVALRDITSGYTSSSNDGIRPARKSKQVRQGEVAVR